MRNKERYLSVVKTPNDLSHLDVPYWGDVEEIAVISARPKVSFCITCGNRRTDLERTIYKNIEDNRVVDADFVILDYGSQDHLAQFVAGGLDIHMESGRVKFFSAPDAGPFHMSHAKNCAHKLATGNILCNLDSDNFTGRKFAEYLIDLFQNHGKIVTAVKYGGGCHGRIAVKRHDFLRLGGYDESFEAYGWDDNDFKERASRSGMNLFFLPKDYCGFIGPLRQVRPETDVRNEQRSLVNIRAGRFVANEGMFWGKIRVQKNFKEWITTI